MGSAQPIAAGMPNPNDMTTRRAGLKTQMAGIYGKEKAEILSSVYARLINEMQNRGFPDADIIGSISALEEKIKTYLTMFGRLGLDEFAIRIWLENVINKQLDKGERKLEFSSDFKPCSWIKIGKNDLYSLLNAAHKDLGFFEKMFSGIPVHEVTGAAFDRLFGDSSGEYDAKVDDVTLDLFTDKMKNEVLVFAGTVSSNALLKTLQLFAAKKFMLVDKDKMAGRVGTALLKLARDNVMLKYPVSKDTDPDNKANRMRLLLKIDEYSGDNSKIIEKLILNKNEDGDQTKDDKSYDYFAGFRKSVLFEYLDALSRSEKKIDGKMVFNLAGLATLCGEGGLIDHLETQGGREKDVYKIDIKNDDVLKAFLATIVDDYGLHGWSGVTTYGPDGINLRSQINWLTKPEEVSAEVQRVDNAVGNGTPTQ